MSLSLPLPPQPVFCLRDGRLGAVSSVCFHENNGDDTILLSGCSNGNLSAWSLKTFRVLHSWTSHDGNGILWLGSYENSFLSQGRDGKIRQWRNNESNWTEIDQKPCSQIGFCPCDLNSNGKLLIPSEDKNKLYMTSIKSGLNYDEVELTHDYDKLGMCMALKLSENDSNVCLAVAGYEDGSILTWDCRNTKKPIFFQQNVHKDPVMCLDYDGKINRGISASIDDELLIWTLKDEFKLVQRVKITNPGLACVKVRSDSRIASTGGWDNRIRVFSWKNLKPLAVLNWHAQTVQCLSFSSKAVNDLGIVMAAGSKDEKISLWNLYNKVT